MIGSELRRFLVYITLISIWLVNPQFIHSQMLGRLDEEVYYDLELWYQRGIIKRLPLLRPVNGALLKELLLEVDSNGGLADQIKTEVYRQKYFKPLVFPRWMLESTLDISRQGTLSATRFGIQAFGTVGNDVRLEGEQTTFLFFSDAGITHFDAGEMREKSLIPWEDFPFRDYVVDKTFIERDGKVLAYTPGYSSLVSWGLGDFFLQAGFSRGSFNESLGDSLVLSPRAPAAPHASLTWMGSHMKANLLFMVLTAASWTGAGSRYPGKYLNLSSLEWSVHPDLELAVWQTAVYGQRIGFEYFIPGIQIVNAELNGNWDNLLMGSGFHWRLGPGVGLSGSIYLDDFEIMKFIFGKFDTRFKAGLDGEFWWTPGFSWLEQVIVSYKMVTPYTYTHYPEFTMPEDTVPESLAGQNLPSYSDYTHNGYNLGFSSGPNSDRLVFRVVSPLGDWGVLTASMGGVRRANSSEDADAEYYSYLKFTKPGTVFDHGYDSEGFLHLFERGKFLAQKTVETRLFSSWNLGWKPVTNSGMPALSLKAVAEYVFNKNLIPRNDGIFFFLQGALKWDY